MRSQNSKVLEAAIPVVVAIILLRNADGFIGMVGAFFAAVAATLFIHVAARFVWAPFLKKAGFWWSTLLPGCAVAAVVLAGGIVSVRLGGLGDVWNQLIGISAAVLFLSWALAAIRGVQDGKGHESLQEPTLIRSRLLRGRRRTHP